MNGGIMPRYPEIVVDLDGENAVVILARCRKQMMRHGIYDRWDEFLSDALSGDYGYLEKVVGDWFSPI